MKSDKQKWLDAIRKIIIRYEECIKNHKNYCSIGCPLCEEAAEEAPGKAMCLNCIMTMPYEIAGCAHLMTYPNSIENICREMNQYEARIKFYKILHHMIKYMPIKLFRHIFGTKHMRALIVSIDRSVYESIS